MSNASKGRSTKPVPLLVSVVEEENARGRKAVDIVSELVADACTNSFLVGTLPIVTFVCRARSFAAPLLAGLALVANRRIVVPIIFHIIFLLLPK